MNLDHSFQYRFTGDYRNTLEAACKCIGLSNEQYESRSKILKIYDPLLQYIHANSVPHILLEMNTLDFSDYFEVHSCFDKHTKTIEGSIRLYNHKDASVVPYQVEKASVVESYIEWYMDEYNGTTNFAYSSLMLPIYKELCTYYGNNATTIMTVNEDNFYIGFMSETQDNNFVMTSVLIPQLENTNSFDN